MSALCLPREPSSPGRLKGFGEDLDSLFNARSLHEEFLGDRIRAGISDQTQDEDRCAHSFVHDRNWDSNKPNTDWRARPATDSFDDYPPRRHDDSFGDKYQDSYDGYSDSYRDGPHQEMDEHGDRDHYDDSRD